ncbi:MAG TPA: pyridoxal 5'-phosphate synthase glutaminase subunit PdxT [Syntrophales bacterium]|nr:pyridoxal 5'-phosphate synthase glutaminase subunit PdxT [Syntrophobacterales bacterium]HNQ01969.1 pyridoxal 5'-phosphate synthase glutaminase subunit PdxT [Syntrophales bacterium]HQL90058.1 pyridoxal 5'-phosphate synthase glutaminase subunit PdxT [Syntrophales bacterium]
MKVGVLALQGAFREHVRMLRALGVEAVEIRLPAGLDEVDGLILPGGESTTMRKLMAEYGLVGPIREFAASGKPVFGTCAGLIVMADRLSGRRQELLNLIDIDVERNAYGRQVDSREADISGDALGPEPFHAVFIRAPQILSTGPGVEPLARYRGQVVLARQKNILVATFHPELTGDTRIHELFLRMLDRKAR